VRLELTTTGATSRCSVQLSYGHIDHDRNRTCLSGFAGPHLAIRSRGQFSTPGRDRTCRRGGFAFRFPDLEAGVPPLELPARRTTLISMRREGFEPPCISKREGGVTARCIAILPPTLLSKISVEGFEPSTPCARGTCAAKLHYTLQRCSRWESNPSFSG
jgi:hypothetical protein